MFICDLCEFNFGSEYTLKAHILKDHYMNQTKPYKCEFCRKGYPLLATLKTHKRAVHENQRPFKCDSCEKSFSFKQTLKIHKSRMHEMNTPTECDLCGKIYSSEMKMKRHKDRIHFTTKK